MKLHSKERIIELFVRGEGYKKISILMGIPKSTVKSVILERM